jgi:hypothetical protein
MRTTQCSKQSQLDSGKPAESANLAVTDACEMPVVGFQAGSSRIRQNVLQKGREECSNRSFAVPIGKGDQAH